VSEIVESKQPYVIAIANGKGGVGKTTTALAIGTILARRGLRVLLIDLDPQGNLTLSLGYKPHRMPSAPAKIPTSGTIFAKETFLTDHKNLHLVFARSLIVDGDYQIQVNTADDLYFLGQDFGVLKTLPYDYVVIDCPPSIGKIMANTLYAADFLIIPSLAEFFSTSAVMDMTRLIDTVSQAKETTLPYRVLITLFDKNNHIHNRYKDELRITYSSNAFDTVIEVDMALRQTAIMGFPSDNSRGVEQYRSFVDELMDIILGEG
jgi:chromosome partitioning protein